MEITTEKSERLVNLYEDNARVWKLLRKDMEPLKSLQVIEDTLLGFGLSNNEIRVYIHLARSGVRKAREISDALSLHRTETYRILRDLEKRGLVSSILEKPLKFMATPFEETIDILIKTKKQKIKLLERQKKNLVNIWFSIPQQKIKPQSKEVFQILEGEEQINLKADELLENSKKEIYLLAPDLDLLRLYHSGFTDKLEKFSRKSLEIRLLTNYSPKSRFIVDKMKLIYVKYLSSNVEELPSFIISDQGQILFSIKNDNDVQDIGMRRKKGRISSLWTNYEAFVKALKMLFFELWNTETSSSLART